MKPQTNYGTPDATTVPDAQKSPNTQSSDMQAQSHDAQSYGARSKKHFKSDIAFRIVNFEVEDSERYTRLAQNIGFDTLQEFLEMECQKALFALALPDKNSPN